MTLQIGSKFFLEVHRATVCFQWNGRGFFIGQGLTACDWPQLRCWFR